MDSLTTGIEKGRLLTLSSFLWLAAQRHRPLVKSVRCDVGGEVGSARRAPHRSARAAAAVEPAARASSRQRDEPLELKRSSCRSLPLLRPEIYARLYRFLSYWTERHID